MLNDKIEKIILIIQKDPKQNKNSNYKNEDQNENKNK